MNALKVWGIKASSGTKCTIRKSKQLLTWGAAQNYGMKGCIIIGSVHTLQPARGPQTEKEKKRKEKKKLANSSQL